MSSFTPLNNIVYGGHHFIFSCEGLAATHRPKASLTNTEAGVEPVATLVQCVVMGLGTVLVAPQSSVYCDGFGNSTSGATRFSVLSMGLGTVLVAPQGSVCCDGFGNSTSGAIRFSEL
ncbi:hypothetical protein BaRGS_00010268 [Batillaria attramentaria]|uniref:Uncharacterized protein n=1 Tax=Batillaria attramentaria TaxID=370345 RepID=A0ABD0LGU1_9CAEN